MTAADVARRARMTHPAASAILRSLAHQGLVASSPAGRGFTYWMLRDNVYVQTLLETVFSAERRIPDEMIEDLCRELGPLAESVTLFGSYARGEQTIDSDVDVAVVVENESAKEGLQHALPDVGHGFARRFGARLSVLVYDRREAAELGRRSPSLWQSITQDYVTVHGIGAEEWVNDGSE